MGAVAISAAAAAKRRLNKTERTAVCRLRLARFWRAERLKFMARVDEIAG